MEDTTAKNTILFTILKINKPKIKLSDNYVVYYKK